MDSAIWFEDPNLFGALLGTATGIIGGLWGALIGLMASRRKYQSFVIGTTLVLILCWTILLIVGIYALVSEQPYLIWCPMILCGIVALIVKGSLLPVIINRYETLDRN